MKILLTMGKKKIRIIGGMWETDKNTHNVKNTRDVKILTLLDEYEKK
jgi:hypothetical protein